MTSTANNLLNEADDDNVKSLTYPLGPTIAFNAKCIRRNHFVTHNRNIQETTVPLALSPGSPPPLLLRKRPPRTPDIFIGRGGEKGGGGGGGGGGEADGLTRIPQRSSNFLKPRCSCPTPSRQTSRPSPTHRADQSRAEQLLQNGTVEHPK